MMPPYHADENLITLDRIRSMLQHQFPAWAHLPLRILSLAGTENIVLRLGDVYLIRLPRISGAAIGQLKDQRYLSQLAPQLPIVIPEVVAIGQPDNHYPYHWTIYRWIEGQSLYDADPEYTRPVIDTLIKFIKSLQSIEPPSDLVGAGRTRPLAEQNPQFPHYFAQLDPTSFNLPQIQRTWDDALAADMWQHPPVMTHGDLLPTNLLLQQGTLYAVIDWGALGAGDPASDLLPAFMLTSQTDRDYFRQQIQHHMQLSNADFDALWRRGRGWAIRVGVFAYPYYINTNPTLTRIARQLIHHALMDFASDNPQ